MKRNRFINELLSAIQQPGTSSSSPEGSLSYSAWRNRVLNLMLVTVTVIGLPAMLINLIPVIEGENWVLMGLYIAAYLWIVTITVLGIFTRRFDRMLPYWLRAGSLVLFPFLAGLSLMYQSGLSSTALIWLFTATLLSSVLFGLRWAMQIGVIGTLSVMVFGFLILTGRIVIEPLNAMTDSQDIRAWLITTFNLLYLSGLAIGALMILINGLRGNIQSADKFTEALTKGLLRPDQEGQLLAGEPITPERILELQASQRQYTTELQRALEQTEALVQVLQILAAPSALLTDETPHDEAVASKRTGSQLGIALAEVVSNLTNLCRADHATLITIDLENELITHYLESDHPEVEVTTVPFHNLLGGLTGWAIQEKKTAISPKKHLNPKTPDPRESKAVQERRRSVNAASLVVAPLVYGERVLGTLRTTRFSDKEDFSQGDIELIEAIASQVASVLANLELYAVQQKRAVQLQAAAEVSQAASSILDIETLLPASAGLIQRGFDLYYTGIFLVDPAREWAVLRAGTGEAGRIQLERAHKLAIGGESMIGQTILTGRAQIAQDVGKGAVRFNNPLLPETRSEMAIPLTARGQDRAGAQVLGAITIQSEHPNAFSTEDINTLTTLAGQLATAIQNARLFQGIELRAGQLDVLNRFVADLTRSLRVADIAATVMSAAKTLFGAEYITVVVPTPSGRLQVVSSTGASERLVRLVNRSTIESDYWKIADRGDVLIANETDSAPIDPLLSKLLLSEGINAFAFVPLATGERVIGALNIGHIQAGAFTEESSNLLRALGDQVTLVLANALLFEDQQRQAAELQELHKITIEVGQQQSDLESVLDLVTRRSMNLLQADGGGVWLWRPDEEELELVITYQVGEIPVSGRRLKVGEGLTGTAYLLRETQVIENYVEWAGKPESYAEAPPFYAAIAVPMVFRDETLGALVFTRSQPGIPFTGQECSLAELLASQAASYIKNAASYEELRSTLARSQALLLVGGALTALDEPVQLFQTTVDTIAKVTEAFQVLLITFNFETRQVVHFVENEVSQDEIVPLSYAELQDGLSGWVIQEKQTAFSPKNPPDQRETPDVQKRRVDAGVGSIIVTPLLGRQPGGELEVLGTLTATRHLKAPDFSGEDVDLIAAIASQVSTAIENIELFTAQAKRARQLQAASEVSQAAASVLDLNQLLTQSVDLICDSFDLYYAGIFLVDTGPDADYAVLRAGTGEAGRIQLERHHQLKVGGDSMIGQAASTGEAKISQALADETALVRFRNPLLPETRSEMALPLIAGSRTIGAMTIQSTRAGAFSTEDITTLGTMANQLAIAIQNARFFEQARQQNENLNILNEMGRALTMLLDPQQIAETVYRYTSRLMDTTNFHVALYDQVTKQVSLPVVIQEKDRISVPSRPLGQAITDFIIRNNQPVLLKENPLEEMKAMGIEIVALGNTAPALSWLGVPMTLGEHVIGVIAVQSITTRGLYMETHRDLLLSIANQAASTFQNAQLFKQTEVQNLELATLNEMSRELGSKTAVKDVVDTTYAYTSMLMDTSYFFFALYHHENEVIEFPLAYDNGIQTTIPPVQKSRGLTQYVIDRREPLLISRGVDEVITELGLERLTVGSAAQSWLGVPLLVGDEVAGVVVVQNAETPGVFNERHRDLLLSIARQASIAIQNSQSFTQVQIQTEELAALNEMGRVLTTMLTVDDVLDSTHTFVQKLFSHTFTIQEGEGDVAPEPVLEDAFIIALYDPETEVFTFPLGIEKGERLNLPPRGRTGYGLTEYVAIQQKPLLLASDVYTMAEQMGIQVVTTGEPAESWMGVPLNIGRGVLGMVSLQSLNPATRYNGRDLNLLISIANQTAIALQNALSFQATQTALAETQLLYQASSAINTAVTYQEIITALRSFTAIGEKSSAGNAPSAISIDLFDAPFTSTHTPVDLQVLERWSSEPVENLVYRYSFANYPSAPHFMAADEPTFLADIASDSRIDEALRHLFLEDLGAQSAIFIPLRLRGEWIGYINGIYNTSSHFTKQELQQLMVLADQATIAVQSLYQLAQIRDQVRREQILSDTTAKVYSLTDIEGIVQTAAQEVGSALGRTIAVGGNITSSARQVGLLSFEDAPDRPLSKDDEALLSAISVQVSNAMERARLLSQTQRQSQDVEALNEMGRLLSQPATEPEQLLKIVYRYVSQLLDIQDSFIAQFDENSQAITYPFAIEANQRIEIPSRQLVDGPESGLTDYLLREREPLLFTGGDEAMLAEMEKRGIQLLLVGEMSQSWLGVPMLIGNQAVGAISIQSLDPNREFDTHDQDLLTAIARQAAIALENARLFQATQAALGETAILYEASASINQAQTYEDILMVLSTYTSLGQNNPTGIELNIFDPTPGTATLSDPSSTFPGTAKPLRFFYGQPGSPADRKEISPDNEEVRKALLQFTRGSEPVLISLEQERDQNTDADVDEGILTGLSEVNPGAKVLLLTPLRIRGGNIGYLLSAHTTPPLMDGEHAARLTALADQAAVAIQGLRSLDLARRRAREAQQRSEELALVNRVVNRVAEAFDLGEGLQIICQELGRSMRAASIDVLLGDGDLSEMTVVTSYRQGQEANLMGLSIPVGQEPVSQAVFRSKRTQVFENATSHPALGNWEPIFQKLDTLNLITLPLIAKSEVIGLVSMHFTSTETTPGPDQIRLAETIVVQTSAAISNARLFDQTQQALSETATLYQASGELNAATSYDDILQILRKFTILGHKNLDRVSINLFDQPWTEEARPSWLIPIARWWQAPPETPPASRYNLDEWSTVEQLLNPRTPTIIEDTTKDPRLNETARKVYQEYLKAQTAILAPLSIGGQWIGQITAYYHEQTAISSDDMRRMTSLIQQAAVLIQTLRLIDETRQLATRLQTAAEIARDTSSSLEYQTLLTNAAHLIMDRFNYYHVAFFLVDQTRQRAFIQAGTGEAGRTLIEENFSVEIGGQSIIGVVAWTGEPLVINDVSRDQIYLRNEYLPATAAEVGIPLRVGSQTIGVLDVQSTQLDAFSDDVIQVLSILADQIATAVSNAQLFAEIRRRATQLQTAAQVSQATTSVLDQNELLQQSVELIRDQFGLYYVGIFLADQADEWAVLRAGTGEAGRIQIERNHRLEIGGASMTGQAVRSGEAQISQDIAGFGEKDSAVVFRNPLLPDTRSEMALPLIARGRTLGAMTIQSTQPAAFTPEDITTLGTLANQLANALQNAQLFERIQTSLTETQTLYTISSVASRSLQVDQTLTEVLEQILAITGFDAGLITVVNPETEQLELISQRNLPEGLQTKLAADGLAGTLCELVYLRGTVITVGDMDEGAPVDVSGLVAAGFHSYLGVPLESKGKILGTLCSFSRQPRATQIANVHLARAVGQQVGIAIENARLYTELRARLDEQQFLYQVTTAAAGAANLSDALQNAVTALHTALGNSLVSILLLDETGVELRVGAAAGYSSSLAQLVIPVGQGITGVVAQTGETLRIADVQAVEGYISGDTDVRSEIAVPLRLGDRVIGVINAESLQLNGFSINDQRLLETLSSTLAAIISNARLFEAEQYQRQVALTLASATAKMSTTIDEAELRQMLMNEISGFIAPDQISMYDWDENQQHFLLSRRHMDGGIPLDGLIAGDFISAIKRPDVWNVYLSRKTSLTTQHIASQPEGEDGNLLETQQFQVLLLLWKVGDAPAGVLEIIRAVPDLSESLFSSRSASHLLRPEDQLLCEGLVDQAANALQISRLYYAQLETAERLKEVDRLKSEFLANMSHELRTPLNSIIGFSRVILKGIDGPVNEVQQQDLTAIYNAGQHLLGLINDVLDLSKIEAGKMDLTFDEVDLGQLINSVMATAKGLIKDRPVQLTAEIQPGLPHVQADNTRIRQVLLNLISNAAKFTDEGSISVLAQQGIHLGRPAALITVKDTGIGIAPEDQEKLFESFSQVDSSATRQAGGTGLGLSITRHLIHLHNGQIWVDSAPGKGAAFTFSLPLPFDEHTKNNLVLALDQNPAILEMYRRYLAGVKIGVSDDLAQEVELIGFTDPGSLEDLAARIQPRAILLDTYFPAYDGWELVARLRTNPATQHIPLIICSLTAETRRAASMGVFSTLLKPILPDDLRKIITNLSAPPNSSDTTGQSILLVAPSTESNEPLCQLIEQTLFLPVGVVSSADEFMLSARANPPGITLIDLSMPGYRSIIAKIQSPDQGQALPGQFILLYDENVSATLNLKEFPGTVLNKDTSNQEIVNHLSKIREQQTSKNGG